MLNKELLDVSQIDSKPEEAFNTLARNSLSRRLKSSLAYGADIYFRPNPLEYKNLIYKAFGVSLVRKLLACGTPKAEHRNYFLAGSTKSELVRVEHETRINEAIHLAAHGVFLGSLAFGAANMTSEQLVALGVFLAPLVVFNHYPIMIQRYNRVRMQPLIDKIKRASLSH